MPTQVAGPPEWARAKQIFQQFGIGRATLMRLAFEGKIEGISVKTDTATQRPIRIYSIKSIREYLARMTQGKLGRPSNK